MHQTENISISFTIWSVIQLKSWLLLHCILECRSSLWQVCLSCCISYSAEIISDINSIDVFRLVEISSYINRSDMVCNNGPDAIHEKNPNSWKTSSDSIFPGLHWRIRCDSISACTGAMKNMVNLMRIKTVINYIKYNNFYMYSFI